MIHRNNPKSAPSKLNQLSEEQIEREPTMRSSPSSSPSEKDNENASYTDLEEAAMDSAKTLPSRTMPSEISPDPEMPSDISPNPDMSQLPYTNLEAPTNYANTLPSHRSLVSDDDKLTVSRSPTTRLLPDTSPPNSEDKKNLEPQISFIRKPHSDPLPVTTEEAKLYTTSITSHDSITQERTSYTTSTTTHDHITAETTSYTTSTITHDHITAKTMPCTTSTTTHDHIAGETTPSTTSTNSSSPSTQEIEQPYTISIATPASCCIPLIKFLASFASSLTFTINTFSGAFAVCKYINNSWPVPANLDAIIHDHLQGVPIYLTVFAGTSAFFSLVANIYQAYDFGPRMRDNYRKELKPTIRKVITCQKTTGKQKGIFTGMVISGLAAGAAGKLAWDTTSQSQYWQIKYGLGGLSLFTIPVMNLLTRGTSTKQGIDNIGWFYKKEQAFILKLFKKLTPLHTKTQAINPTQLSSSLIPNDSSALLDSSYSENLQLAIAATTDMFNQYEVVPPNNLEHILKEYFLLIQREATLSYQIKKLAHYLFIAIFVAVAWDIYFEKLASLLQDLAGDEVQGIARDISRGIISCIGSSPHAFLFYYSSKDILSHIRNSFPIAPFTTLALIAGILLTSFGMLYVDLNIETHDPLVPLPNPIHPDGWIFPILAFFSAFWVNLSSVLKMTVLKERLAEDARHLKDNPYRQIVDFVIQEKPTLEDKKQSPSDTITISISNLETGMHEDNKQASSHSDIRSLSQAIETFKTAQSSIVANLGMFKKAPESKTLASQPSSSDLNQPLLAGGSNSDGDQPPPRKSWCERLSACVCGPR